MNCYRDDEGWFLKGRHLEHPDDWTGTCPGCQPCSERHCGECREGTHLGFGENTCALCIGKTRADLRMLVDLYATLPDEAVEKGVHSEAANLYGPFADPEAFAWRRAAKAKRDDLLLSELEADDEHHPRAVLKRWIQALSEDYGDDYDRGDDIASLTDWIDMRLGRIANDIGQDFGLFKREVKRCRAHLEAVLHAGEQRDTGAPCMKCNVPLEKTWGGDDRHDGWRCPRCNRTSSHAQYLFAVQNLHTEQAEWLTAESLSERTGLTIGRIRVWATRKQIRKRQHSGQVQYSVADAEAKIDGQRSA